MRLWLLGVRGSTPAPGADFVRYGGHTSCVAFQHDGADEPSLVLDAGTGIRMLSSRLGSAAFRGAIVLTHLHWDHVQGLPFFAKGDHPQSDIHLYLPAQDGLDGRDQLARLLSPPLFPILPEGLQGAWRFHAIEAGSFEAGGFRLTAFDVEHKGGRTFGYRVEDDSGSVGYVPDHAAVSRSITVQAQLQGVDMLIHDSQFVDSEREVAGRFGHSTVIDSLELGAEVGAHTVVLFHHGPGRTDDQLDAIADSIQSPMAVVVAREGLELAVGAPV